MVCPILQIFHTLLASLISYLSLSNPHHISVPSFSFSIFTSPSPLPNPDPPAPKPDPVEPSPSFFIAATSHGFLLSGLMLSLPSPSFTISGISLIPGIGFPLVIKSTISWKLFGYGASSPGAAVAIISPGFWLGRKEGVVELVLLAAVRLGGGGGGGEREERSGLGAERAEGKNGSETGVEEGPERPAGAEGEFAAATQDLKSVKSTVVPFFRFQKKHFARNVSSGVFSAGALHKIVRSPVWNSWSLSQS